MARLTHDRRGFCRSSGGPGAETAGQSHWIPRCFCAQQQVPRAGDTGQVRQGRPACCDGAWGGTDAGRPPCVDDPGTAPETGVRHRDLPGLRWGGADHRLIEDPEVIEKILTHLDAKSAEPRTTRSPPCRAPPQAGLFDWTRIPRKPADCDAERCGFDSAWPDAGNRQEIC